MAQFRRKCRYFAATYPLLVAANEGQRRHRPGLTARVHNERVWSATGAPQRLTSSQTGSSGSAEKAAETMLLHSRFTRENKPGATAVGLRTARGRSEAWKCRSPSPSSCARVGTRRRIQFKLASRALSVSSLGASVSISRRWKRDFILCPRIRQFRPVGCSHTASNPCLIRLKTSTSSCPRLT